MAKPKKKREPKKATPKEVKATAILSYLGDPDNEWLARGEIATKVLGYANKQSLWKQFSTEDLAELEGQALEERKRRSAGKRVKVYDALYEKAKAGDVAAIKEYLDRTEGKVVNVNKSTIDGDFVSGIRDLMRSCSTDKFILPGDAE